MKRLLFCFAIVATGLASCDPIEPGTDCIESIDSKNLQTITIIPSASSGLTRATKEEEIDVSVGKALRNGTRHVWDLAVYDLNGVLLTSQQKITLPEQGDPTFELKLPFDQQYKIAMSMTKEYNGKRGIILDVENRKLLYNNSIVALFDGNLDKEYVRNPTTLSGQWDSANANSAFNYFYYVNKDNPSKVWTESNAAFDELASRGDCFFTLQTLNTGGRVGNNVSLRYDLTRPMCCIRVWSQTQEDLGTTCSVLWRDGSNNMVAPYGYDFWNDRILVKTVQSGPVGVNSDTSIIRSVDGQPDTYLVGNFWIFCKGRNSSDLIGQPMVRYGENYNTIKDLNFSPGQTSNTTESSFRKFDFNFGWEIDNFLGINNDQEF